MNEVGEFNFDKFSQDVELLTKVCKQLLGTKHYNSLGEAGIFAILQRSKAMNIDPFDALNGGLYYINGKVGMSTELMASLIRRQGHKVIKDPSSNDQICTLFGKRSDNGDEWTSTFSMVDADRAGLKKNMFLKYPGIMLYNRAMSALARQLFPDVIKGCGYEKDELEEISVNKSVKNCQASEIEVSQPQIEMSEPKELPCEPPITDEMENEFQQLLKGCTEKFKENVGNYIFYTLKSNTLKDVTYKEYLKLLNGIKKHLAEIKTLEATE